MSDEWPKPWSEIKEPTEADNAILSDDLGTWMEYPGGMRGYRGTLHINVDAGHDTDDNRDLWLPFGVYLQRGGDIET
jgi:hypothetical protein